MIGAGAPFIQVISHDILRVQASAIEAAESLELNIYFWSRLRGVETYEKGQLTLLSSSLTTCDDVIAWYLNSGLDEFASFDTDDRPSKNSILFLQDSHFDFQNESPTLLCRFKEFSSTKSRGLLPKKTIMMSQPYATLPADLEKDIQLLHLPLPDKEVLQTILEKVKEDYEIEDRNFEKSDRLLAAALGLSMSEAQLAFSKAAVLHSQLTEAEIDTVIAEKEQVINKSGLLEYFHPSFGLEALGGLENLKQWLARRKNAFSEEAREYGLEFPKGFMMLGLPGTGKSLSAKAISTSWQLPLLRLDFGKIFGGIVGQSEENLRATLQLAETISPCILWIDEIEKGFSGLQSSGHSDGGTTARILGTFLTWMQEKESPVFVLATANHINLLPPELLRKGRVDEIFFLDLPTQIERCEILKIHLRKRNLRDELFSEEEIESLARLSRGFTGAEIEEAVKDSLFIAFDDGRELALEDIKKAINSTSPLSATMHEIIADIRNWVKGRAVLASSTTPEELAQQGTESSLRLPQEMNNMFIKSKGKING